MHIIHQTNLWSHAPHNAFSDLCEFNNMLVCCFREATNHISGDGKIRVLYLDWQGKVLRHQLLRIAGADLRDPKLSLTPDNKLMLLAYARYCGADNKTRFGQPTTWLSQDGYSWTAAKGFADRNWWLWRISWHNDKAYGVAYNRSAQSTRLYSGYPRGSFDCIEPELFGLRKHGKGYPNESDLQFAADGTAYILLRRDADTCTAQLGIAKPPYRRWQWQDLGFYLGGPAMLLLEGNQALLAGRIWRASGPKTALIGLDLVSWKKKLLCILPSGGDTSYPGLVRKGDRLYISYYASHQGQQSRIYLSELELKLT
ncbi:sialidase family protein [Bowmanella denitrificans]|uniref:Sialidase family protein n=1 Tax=Bowmanella denitrificans TaxID=366582 RepID=A0ABP3HBR5_9ALTE